MFLRVLGMQPKAATPAPTKTKSNFDSRCIDDFTRAIIEAMGVGFLAVSASGTTILSNAIARDSFGAAPGGDLQEAFPALWPKVLQVMKGKGAGSEFSLRRKQVNYLIKVNPILLDSERSEPSVSSWTALDWRSEPGRWASSRKSSGSWRR